MQKVSIAFNIAKCDAGACSRSYPVIEPVEIVYRFRRKDNLSLLHAFAFERLPWRARISVNTLPAGTPRLGSDFMRS